MKIPMRKSIAAQGFTLLEVMVAVFVLVVGLLGLAGLQAVSSRANLEAYQRAQALLLVNDMVERINAFRRSSQGFRTDIGGSNSFLGTGANATCTISVAAECEAWSALLQGASEVSTVTNTRVGAMIDARGCVDYANGTEVDARPGTGLFTITVVWRSPESGFSNAGITCASSQFTDLSERRFVRTQLRIANLN